VRPTCGVGAVLAVLALPHVLYIAKALVDLWGTPSPQADDIMFLHYEVLDVFRWAFVASHGWLLCVITRWRSPSVSNTLRALTLLVGAEAVLVFSIVALLRARGFALSAF
jgi:hypothetical protein